MQFLTTLFTTAFMTATTVLAAGPRPNATPANNANRPIATGACCIAATSLKQDICSVNGQTGRCVPAASANCGASLTCVADSLLTCDPTQVERGREKCVAA